MVAALPARTTGVNEYRFVDDAVLGGVPYLYWLVEVEVDESTVIYGPQRLTMPANPERMIYLPALIR